MTACVPCLSNHGLEEVHERLPLCECLAHHSLVAAGDYLRRCSLCRCGRLAESVEICFLPCQRSAAARCKVWKDSKYQILEGCLIGHAVASLWVVISLLFFSHRNFDMPYKDFRFDGEAGLGWKKSKFHSPGATASTAAAAGSKARVT